MLQTLISLAANPDFTGLVTFGFIADLLQRFRELFAGFGVEWKLIFAQALNFLIVAFLLYKFAFKPVLKTIDERQQKIADGLQYAQEMKDKLADAERKQQEVLRNAQQEAQKIISEARTSAKDFYDRQTQEATQRVEEMLERGRQANELERQKMLADVRQEVAKLVVQVSERVLARQLSEQDKSAFNARAAEELANVG